MAATEAPDEPTAPARRGVLDRIERIGNALPDPVFIFLFFIGLVVAASVAAHLAGWSAVHPITGKTLAVDNLMSAKNVARLLVDMPGTLTGFPPLGLVLVVMLGAAVAERSGLFAAILGGLAPKLPLWALTPGAFLLGLMSHHAADAAYVVLIPLTALIYAQAGRHPLAGLAAAYAGISGAFAGNLIPGQFDVLMLGITQSAARLIDPAFVMNPLGNWWFTAAIGLLFTPIAWFVTDRIVEPRLPPWRPEGEIAETLEQPDVDEAGRKRGLARAGWAALAVAALFAALTLLPGFHPLVDDAAKGPARYTPFYQALIAAFGLLFFAAGWAYGSGVRTVRSHRDVVEMMGEGMKSMGPYIVLAFFAAHFVAMFAWSNLGPVMAIKGAAGLKALALPTPLLLLALLAMSAVLDLAIGSASAKWIAMAPIAVPMLMLLGVSPELATAAYRMGDSFFNIVTPVASNFPLVLIMCRRWDKGFGVGSLIALMLPYTLCFIVAGLSLVVVWSSLRLPVGPGAPATYTLPAIAAPR